MLDTRKDFVAKVMHGLAKRKEQPRHALPRQRQKEQHEYCAYASERHAETLMRYKRCGKYAKGM